MRGPRCHIQHTADVLERFFAVIVVMRGELYSLNHGRETDKMRAAVAEAELQLRDMQNHIASCEECEAP